jgi:pSer/pThr/pTyr-binding forkhead associated (FHA) protein
MPAVAVNIVKILVVLALYGFLWVVTRSIRSHLAAPAAASGIAPAVLVFTEPSALAGRVVAGDRPTGIGRGESVDLSITDPFASDRHVRLDRIEGTLVIEDLGSTNGTLVNGAPVTARRTLSRGDAVRIGQTIMEVR